MLQSQIKRESTSSAYQMHSLDGSSHDNKYEYDLRRQLKLESLGVRFIRFDDLDVKRNINDVLRIFIIIISEQEKIIDK